MKTTGILLIIASVVASVWMVVDVVRDNYVYNNTIGSYWNLSVEASSLDQKSAYFDQFISAVQAANLSGNEALFFPTPDNSYQGTMTSLLSLQTRMHAFVGQDPTSMAYQQAISQITAQEEDDNSSTVGIIEDLWFKQYHYFFWNPIYNIFEFLLPILGVALGIFLIAEANDN
jgi:hypothetical protein